MAGGQRGWGGCGKDGEFGDNGGTLWHLERGSNQILL